MKKINNTSRCPLSPICSFTGKLIGSLISVQERILNLTKTQPLVAVGNEMCLLLGILRQPSIYLTFNDLEVLGVASVFVFGMLLFCACKGLKEKSWHNVLEYINLLSKVFPNSWFQTVLEREVLFW